MRLLLLTEKDYAALDCALSRGKEITIERSAGGETIVVQTVTLTGKTAQVWGVPMIIQAWTRRAHTESRHNFEGVDEMKKYL